MTKVDENMAQAKKMLETIVERDYELQKEVGERKTKCHILEEENKKLKDEFMLKLAEAFLLPPTSNQMAEYKQWNFYKWYDEIKNQMRKEIKEGK